MIWICLKCRDLIDGKTYISPISLCMSSNHCSYGKWRTYSVSAKKQQKHWVKAPPRYKWWFVDYGPFKRYTIGKLFGEVFRTGQQDFKAKKIKNTLNDTLEIIDFAGFCP